MMMRKPVKTNADKAMAAASNLRLFSICSPLFATQEVSAFKEDTELILREILADFDAIGGEIQRCRR